MRNLLPAMSPSDAKSLSSDAVGSLVGELAADVQKMAKTTRETILNKVGNVFIHPSFFIFLLNPLSSLLQLRPSEAPH